MMDSHIAFSFLYLFWEMGGCSMPKKKFTYEEVQNYIEVESSSGCKLLSKEYENIKTKLTILCRCGKKFSTSFSQFKHKNKRQCNKCGRKQSQSFSYEEVKNFIETESNSGCKLISKEYSNCYDDLEILCSCGNTFYAPFTRFKNYNKRQCNGCGYDEKFQKQMLTYEEIKRFVEVESDSSCKLLSKEYTGNGNNLLFKCACGEDFFTSYSSFRRGKRQCDKCSHNELRNKFKIPYEEVMNKVNELGYELLSDTYENYKSRLKIKCDKGHIYDTTFVVVRRGCRCPICSAEEFSGEGHPNWQGGITELNNHLRRILNNWKKDVFEYNLYKCVLTGTNSNELVIHHLVSFNSIIRDVLNKSNLDIKPQVKDYTHDEIKHIENLFLKYHNTHTGIPLQKEMHILFHQIYGYGDNTPDQFEELRTRLKLGEFNDFLEENNLELII